MTKKQYLKPAITEVKVFTEGLLSSLSLEVDNGDATGGGDAKKGIFDMEEDETYD